MNLIHYITGRKNSLHYREKKFSALNFLNVNFDKKMKFFVAGREDTFWWLSDIGRSYNPI